MAPESHLGGVLRWVSVVQLVFLVHDLRRIINLTGVY